MKKSLTIMKIFIADLVHKNKIIMAILLLLLLFWMVSIAFFVKEDRKIATAAEQVNGLSLNIRKFYSNRPSFWGLNTRSAVENGIVSADMVQNNEVFNSLGKPVMLGQGSSGTSILPGTHGFDVAFVRLNHKECVGIATHKFSEQALLGIVSITVESEGHSELFNWENGNTLPLSSTQAESACANDNAIIWHYE